MSVTSANHPALHRLDEAHARARQVALKHGITPYDVLHCSEKFWNLHLDPVCVRDFSAWALLTIQLNLCGGVVSFFAAQSQSRHLDTLAKQIVNFDISAQFLMTEVAHGLDARNLETTATLLPNGSFDLHTPHSGADKFMPPTLPDVGVPRLGIVMARLISLEGKDLGIRAFIVPLNDGVSMCPGITAKPLPDRCGVTPLGHALTHFNHVNLPNHSLLGPLHSDLHPRVQFLSEIWRVSIGSATLTCGVISTLQTAAYIVATYSKRRMVGVPRVPIFTFRTQHRPILHALARSFVLASFYKSLRTTGGFDSASKNKDDLDHLQIRNAYATIFKVTTVNLCKESLSDLGERCGAQGTFAYNQLIPGEMSVRGAIIAEGDSLVLSIRLAFELLLGRYTLSSPDDPNHHLASHESALFSELQTQLISISNTKNDSSDHRSQRANATILPRANSLIEAIGVRMAYEAALLDPNIDKKILRLFTISCIQRDIGWYIESGRFSRAKLFEDEMYAIEELLPKLDDMLKKTGVEPYVYAKICKEDSWREFVDGLPVIGGGGTATLQLARL
ncbi:hypothetical protein E1B28_005343 [Marasmius oreades]|uniref:Acyl-CoA oxidase C-alpha1 domain-containing protein n=1 Tax=Marasmius oreades TaxID=181124 RepID=A0A9P7S2Z8_9AGAR|nr:uncharacterized protein E1B28_005343 [Marasmius oreades]KAG7094511.1 hypothetical protein E1B28_005343 [Marasmius oreades]